MTVTFVPSTTGAPAGKLADAELHFSEGVLAGLKLVGFTVWDRRDDRGRGVTFPARQYMVSGERRHYVLLRVAGEQGQTEPLRELILSAYATYEERSSAG
jgi:hypothetical protein